MDEVQVMNLEQVNFVFRHVYHIKFYCFTALMLSCLVFVIAISLMAFSLSILSAAVMQRTQEGQFFNFVTIFLGNGIKTPISFSFRIV